MSRLEYAIQVASLSFGVIMLTILCLLGIATLLTPDTRDNTGEEN